MFWRKEHIHSRGIGICAAAADGTTFLTHPLYAHCHPDPHTLSQAPWIHHECAPASHIPSGRWKCFLIIISSMPTSHMFESNLTFGYILQVWKQRKVWEGFIKCCQRAGAQSFTVLLQLPPPQLADVFSVAPDLRSRLLSHIATLTENQVKSICFTIIVFFNASLLH